MRVPLCSRRLLASAFILVLVLCHNALSSQAAEKIRVPDPATHVVPSAAGEGAAKSVKKMPAEESSTSNAPQAVMENDLSVEQREAVQKSAEVHHFQAEVTRLMDIIINSLYTQKEVFLRELISNAADALEKVRFMAINDPDILGSLKDLEIFIEKDAKAKTLTITDTGVGMTREDLVNNLGTVAKSGTTNFLEAIAQGGDVNLIGQFGVGFYSAFLVADKVTVISKHNDDDQYIWESSADASFTIAKDPRGNILGRGTRISLHLKQDALGFLEEVKLRNLITHFSQFVSFPLKLRVDSADPPKDDSETPAAQWVQLNTDKALWLRSKDEISDVEYLQFYTALTMDHADPITYTHFAAEGEVEFKALLYIPTKKSNEAWNSYLEQKNQGLRLYVRRVLINDDSTDLTPKWLTFVRGVVDSDDLPLKVDRESLSQSKITGVISKKLTRKVLDTLKKLLKDSVEEKEKALAAGVQANETKYDKFWKAYGKNLKAGCVDIAKDRPRLIKLFVYPTTKTGKNHTITIQQYVERMQEDQTEIFYLASDSYEAAMESPHMQYYLQNDIEVIIAPDTLDEPCLTAAVTFEKKTFAAIEKSTVGKTETDDEKKKLRSIGTMYKPLVQYLKKTLGSKILSAEVSLRLLEDPLVITTNLYAHSALAERVMRAQALFSGEDIQGPSGKVLKFNPYHPLMKRLLHLVKEDDEDPALETMVSALYDAALLASGFPVVNPHSVVGKIYKSIEADAGVDPDARVEEIEVPEEPEAKAGESPMEENLDLDEGGDAKAEDVEDGMLGGENVEEDADKNASVVEQEAEGAKDEL